MISKVFMFMAGMDLAIFLEGFEDGDFDYLYLVVSGVCLLLSKLCEPTKFNEEKND